MIASLCLLLSSTYNPLQVAPGFSPKVVDIDFVDSNRNRTVPVRIYLPSTTKPAPVVIFSHGLGGNRNNNGYLGKHFAARGYVAIHTQHPGSDTDVLTNAALGQRLAKMKEAANGKNALLRYEDIPFVIDELKRRNISGEFKGRFDLGHIGMSGHSFGAVTTEGVSGQTFPVIGQRYTDPRIDAAIMYSPSAPKRGTADAFSKVSVPWLCMTGTEDVSPINDTDFANRLSVFEALPRGKKYEVVLYGAEHSAFSERALPGDQKSRNPNHHKVILAVSTAFWDTYLKGDKAAETWLNGPGPRSIMEPKDEWKTK